MTYTAFYDQVLTELMAGTVHDGINLLVGMLDTVQHDFVLSALAQSQLENHMLFGFLAQDPLCQSVQSPQSDARSHSNRLCDLMCDLQLDPKVSTTGRRLFDVTSSLTLARAIRARRNTTAQKLQRAWQAGQKICVLGHGQFRALEGLAGQDLSNITLIGADRVALSTLRERLGQSFMAMDGDHLQSLQNAGSDKLHFDLICAADVPDTSDANQLASLLTASRDCLSATGKVILASFVPRHLGAGWRTICLGWVLNCYLETQLALAGDQACLQVATARDATNSVVWSTFTRGFVEKAGER